MVEKYGNLELGEIVPRAQPATGSEGKESPGFWCMILYVAFTASQTPLENF